MADELRKQIVYRKDGVPSLSACEEASLEVNQNKLAYLS